MPGIFISYRRADTQLVAGRVHDRLCAHFEGWRVFKDVDSISGGAPFREALDEALEECDALLVLMGDQWSGRRADGSDRVRDPDDVVRQEVERGLARGIFVLPVLVGEAAMPPASALAPSLHPLLERQALRIRPDPDFHRDMIRVLAALEEGVAGEADEEEDRAQAAGPGHRSSVGSRLKLHLPASVFWLGYDLGCLLTHMSTDCSRVRFLGLLGQVAHHADAIGVDLLARQRPYLLHRLEIDDDRPQMTRLSFSGPPLRPARDRTETIAERFRRLADEVRQLTDERWNFAPDLRHRVSRELAAARDLLAFLIETNQPGFQAAPGPAIRDDPVATVALPPAPRRPWWRFWP